MIIELFSGIGRFETDEQVVYISNDIRTKPTICADIRYLPLKKNLKPRILHGNEHEQSVDCFIKHCDVPRKDVRCVVSE